MCDFLHNKYNYTIEDVKSISKSKNIICLDDNYKSFDSKMSWKCVNCDNVWIACFRSIVRNVGCSKCKKQQMYKLTIEYVRDFVKKRNITCLNDEYVNCRTKMNWLCDICGTKWETMFCNIRSGSGCYNCFRNKRKLNLNVVKKILKEKNITCLATEYKNNSTKIECKCDICSCIWFPKFSNIMSGAGCINCGRKRNSDNRKLSFDYLKLKMKEKNVTCLATKYDGNLIKMPCKCDICGYIWNVSYSLFSGCQRCNIGKGERIIRNFFEKVFKTSFMRVRLASMKNPKTGRSLELDGYCGDIGEGIALAFEYNGRQHYEPVSDFFDTKEEFESRKERDVIKQELCKQNKIKLIIIPQLNRKINGKVLSAKDLKNYIKQQCVSLNICLPENYDDIQLDLC